MMEDNNFKEVIFLYSITLSVHLLGNYFSKFFFKCLINKPFKAILLIYYFIFLVHYVLLLLGTFFDKNKYSIIIIIEGRFLLGFSYLKQLSKEYVDQFVPKINQINANKNYMFYLYIGFTLGILSNSLYYFYKIFTFNLFNIQINFIHIIISVYLLLALIFFFVVICSFIEPTNNILLNEEFLKETKKHRLSRNLINNEEKKIAEFHDKNYAAANSSSEFAQTNLLSTFISQHLDEKYYNKICIILIFLLISTEYTRENLLLLIPRLFYYIYDKYPINDDILSKYLFLVSVIFFAFLYIFSYIFIRCFLKNHYTMSFKICSLFIIMLLLLILSLCFIIIIKPDIIIYNEFLTCVILPQIITGIMLMLNEIYHIIIINIFIYLLPSEEIRICCIRLSSLINFITKFVRVIPSIIIIFLYFFNEDFENEILLNRKEINYCNIFLFGIQSLIYLICFLVSLSYRSYFRSTSKIRIRNKYI